ncbi:hypothetical protein BDW62DRAFT_170320 [Aspergillus aurantiobrunneus]
MDTNHQQSVSEPTRSTVLPIAQLSPDHDRLHQSYIRSVVTLLWPYSSSTGSLSLLLAEPDFRLRRSNGQVKVLFHGHVAEEVARTHIGIGDHVYLGLAGSRLVKNDAATQTPGKGVSWDVHFDASASLEVWRDSKLLSTVKLNNRTSLTPPPADNIAVAPTTPIANGDFHASGPLGSTLWQSPAFLGKSRMSFGFTDPAIDPFVEEDGYVSGKGRKRPRFSMRSSEWRVVDEPESPRDRDLPDDWMAIFDEELANGSDAGEETAVAQGPEENSVAPSSAVVPEIVPAVDTDISMMDSQADASAAVATQPIEHTDDDAPFFRPHVAPSSVSELTKLGDLDYASHLSTDTPHLHPIFSRGLPDPSPLVTMSNTPSEYLTSAIDVAAAAQSILPTAAAEEVSERDKSATFPHTQSDGERTHMDEEDAVTVYTDDVQILPDSVLNSGEAAFSPRPSDSKVDTSTIIGDKTLGEAAEVSDHTGAHAAETVTSKAEPEEPDSDSGQGLRGEGAEDIDSLSSEGEADRASEKRLPAPLYQNAEDDSDGVSATWSENEEVDTEVEGIPKHDKFRPIQSESVSLDESRNVSEEPGYSDDYDDEDDVGRSEEDASDQEEDYNDDELEGRPRDEYDYSGSESEPGYEEEPPQNVPSKTAEPEVIVLDSDSEDEAPSERPADAANRHAEETPDEASYDSENESQLKEVYDEGDLEDDGFENDQEDEDDHDKGVEHEGEEETEGANEDMEDEQSMEDEKPIDGSRSEPERMDEDVHEHDAADEYFEAVQEQPDMETRAPPAEPLLHPERSPEPNNLPASHEHIGDFQPMLNYSYGPRHDSLDYLATISESAERLNTISESTHPGYDMPVDPNLYKFGTTQENITTEPNVVEHPRKSSVENDNEAAIESFRSIPERHLALQLDGAAPSEIVSESAEERTSIPNHNENRQLITPGPSQLVETDQAPDLIESSGEMLPTPNLTQEALSKLESQQPPQTPTEARTFGVLESGSPPVAAVKLENGPNSPELGESEPAPPRVVVDTANVVDAAIPTPAGEAQVLQASIEVDDEAEGAIDDNEKAPVGRHYPGLRSKLSYFAPLATLIDHYNALVDTISIASEVTPPIKAVSGKKDFILTLQLTDPSMAGTTVYAQILRPYNPALPTLQEGDAILLRNFRVESFDHSVILVSDDTSAWAVFSASSEDPEIAGPPVEYGAEERTFATDLRQWYVENGLAMVADNQLQASVGMESRGETPTSSTAHSDAGSVDIALRETRGDTSSSRGSRRRKSHRRITIHKLRDGRRYTEVGSSPGDGSIHELRDGTVYANL